MKSATEVRGSAACVSPAVCVGQAPRPQTFTNPATSSIARGMGGLKAQEGSALRPSQGLHGQDRDHAGDRACQACGSRHGAAFPVITRLVL